MRSTIPAPIQAELDAAIVAGADETTQALVWAGLRGANVVPRKFPAAGVRDVVERYRRWQLEEATEPAALKRSMALLYGPEKE